MSDKQECTSLTDQSEDELWDVLPLFKMHQSMHSRSLDSESTLNISNTSTSHTNNHELPTYSELASPPQYLLNGPQTSEGSDIFNESLSQHGQYHRHSSFSSQVDSNPYEDLHSNTMFKNSVLNNIDKLPRLMNADTSKIQIEIRIIHAIPKSSSEVPKLKETSFVEFKPGDIIHGYVTVENKVKHSGFNPLRKGNSDNADVVNLDMFDVCFEGRTSISKDYQLLESKMFLSMSDLAASSYISGENNTDPGIKPINIINSTGVSFEKCFDYEKCYMGIPSDHVLKPNIRYKKYFTFKIPFRLLDTCCPQEHWSHLLMPPSASAEMTGMIYKANDKGREVGEIGKFKYATTFTVNARIIGKNLSSKTNGFVVLKEKKFHVKVIPPGEVPPAILFEVEPEEQINKLFESFRKEIEKSEMQVASRHNISIPTSNSVQSGITLESIKTSESDSQPGSTKYHSISSTSISTLSSREQDNFERIRTYTELFYKKVSLPKNLFHDVLFPHKSSSCETDEIKLGGIIVSTLNCPSFGVPDRKPIIGIDDNYLADKSKYSDTHNDQESKSRYNLRLKLKYKPEKNCPVAKNLTRPMNGGSISSDNKCFESNLPQLAKVEVKLVSINVFSKHPIPIKLSSDFFTNKYVSFKEKKEELKKLIERLNFLAKYKGTINTEIMESIQSMADLKFCTADISEEALKTKSPVSYDLKAWKKNPDLNEPFDLEYLNELKIKLSIDYKKLTPSFETCYFCRLYCLKVTLKFEKSDYSVTYVPIRIGRA